MSTWDMVTHTIQLFLSMSGDPQNKYNMQNLQRSDKLFINLQMYMTESIHSETKGGTDFTFYKVFFLISVAVLFASAGMFLHFLKIPSFQQHLVLAARETGIQINSTSVK